MTRLVAQMVLDLKLCRDILHIKDVFAIEDSDLIEEVEEAIYKGRIIYRLYRVKTGHGGYIINSRFDDNGYYFESLEPISHFDEIISGAVKYKLYDWGKDNSPDNEWAMLPYFKVPPWASTLKDKEYKEGV